MLNSLAKTYDEFFRENDEMYYEFSGREDFDSMWFLNFHEMPAHNLCENFYETCKKDNTVNKSMMRGIYCDLSNIMIGYCYISPSREVINTYYYNPSVDDDFIINRLIEYEKILEECPYRFKLMSDYTTNLIYCHVKDLLYNIISSGLDNLDSIVDLINLSIAFKSLSVLESEVFGEE